MRKLLVLLAIAALLSGCGSLENNTGTLQISVGNGIMRNVVNPGDALLVDHFDVHGVGTSGGANGQTFDATVSGGGGTFNRQLTTGTWSISVNAWNKASPSVIIGTGSAIAEVMVGTPAVANITIEETIGDGTLDAQMQWYPNVIQVPQPKITVKKYGGAPQVLTLDSQDATHAAVIESLSNGWYVGFFEIRDAGTLAAGVVQAFRILRNYTTTWTENLQVNLLEGTLTVNLQYQDGRPLFLSLDTEEGDVSVFTDEPKTITVLGADQDSGKGLLYAWYVDGQPASLGDLASFIVDPASYPAGSIHYLSAVVFQDDGARAASANWKVTMAGLNPARMGFAGTVKNGAYTMGVALTMKVYDATTHLEVDTLALEASVAGTIPYDLGAQVSGTYHLAVVVPAGGDFPAGTTCYWSGGGSWTTNISGALDIGIPHGIGVAYPFTVDITP
jgi:hypothetical protein